MPLLENLLLPEFRSAVAARDWPELRTFAETLHPSSVAEMLTALDDPAEQALALEAGIPDLATPLFEYLLARDQDALIGHLSDKYLARLLEDMSHDERADLVNRMEDERREGVLPLVARADREDIRRLTGYEEGTAGALMTSEYAALPASVTVAEALAKLRREAPDRETIYYIYVIDGERRLKGFVSLKDLILAPPSRTVGQVMKGEVLFAAADADAGEAAQVLARYDLLALPVVDAEQRLVGIITHDDVLDLQQTEATEDIHRMGAVQPVAEAYLDAPFFEVWRKRTFWLSLLFIAELGTFSAMANFQEEIDRVSALALLVPLCIATGGNSGSQAATLITRALALGQVRAADWARVLRHELLMGLALGASLGAIGFLRGWTTPESVRTAEGGKTIAATGLGLTLGLAVAGICLWGTVVGSMMPLIFRRLGLDPAVASSPFVATFVDVTGIVIFFSLAKALLF